MTKFAIVLTLLFLAAGVCQISSDSELTLDSEVSNSASIKKELSKIQHSELWNKIGQELLTSKTKEQEYQPKIALTSAEAKDFVLWWLGGAFDYHSSETTVNHAKAERWMSQSAGNSFRRTFWSKISKRSKITKAQFKSDKLNNGRVKVDGLVELSNIEFESDNVDFCIRFEVQKRDAGLRISDYKISKESKIEIKDFLKNK